MNIENVVEELRKSALFNLSLSSKELFHSNFLAWVCEKFPNEFGSILNENFSLKIEKPDAIIKYVTRERKGIDLVIGFHNKEIIIENKVKSIPDKDQLNRYKTKSDQNSHFILLTLMEPEFNLDEIGWEILTYQELSIILSKLVEEIDKDSYNAHILSDYINFIQQLSILAKSLKIDLENGNFEIYTSDFNLLKTIRLHDIYLKYKYYQLMSGIKNDLLKKFDSKDIIFGKRYNHKENQGKIAINFSYVRGKGVLNIEYSNLQEIVFGVMIDGIRYNQYLYTLGETKKSKFEIAEKLRDDNNWFDLSFVPKDETYPKNHNGFNSFDNKNVLYRATNISSQTSFKKLIDRISIDVERMIDMEDVLMPTSVKRK